MTQKRNIFQIFVVLFLLTGTSSVQSVTSKVTTPVSLTAQRFTVQIPPPSQTATTKTSKRIFTSPSLMSTHLVALMNQIIFIFCLKNKHENKIFLSIFNNIY